MTAIESFHMHSPDVAVCQESGVLPANLSLSQVKYILLDCDNTLCQSERLAFEACADLTNEVLKKYDIDATYTTESLLEDFVGNNFRNMLIGLQKKHNFSMSQADMEKYVDMELDRVTAKLAEKAVECPGVTEQLEWAKAQGYPMSVVSTSAKPRVVASLKKCNLMRFFTVRNCPFLASMFY